jgi:undecaprenyl-diphosphatase
MFDIEWLDIRLFYLINNGTQNSLFDTLMPLVTTRNNWWPLIAVAAISLLAFGKKKGRVAFIVMAVSVGLSDFTASSIIKPIVGRIRPCHMLEGVNLLVSCTKSYSFPSSHASNIFALAVAGTYYYRKAAIPLFMLALLIGYSRVYVGVHYPFDILGGFFLGGMIAGGAVWVERKALDVRRGT